MRKVKDLLPNIGKDEEVLLFYPVELSGVFTCVEHYPFDRSELIGRDYCDLCLLCEVTLPLDCKYAFYRREGYTTMLKERGAYLLIINSKIQFPQNEENAPFRN